MCIRDRPKEPDFYLDKRYIIASMGLLSQVAPEVALTILQREVLPLSLIHICMMLDSNKSKGKRSFFIKAYV